MLDCEKQNWAAVEVGNNQREGFWGGGIDKGD